MNAQNERSSDSKDLGMRIVDIGVTVARIW
jgi:hypothetical protein